MNAVEPLGGPWTRHGHDVSGITVAGRGRPPVARCGGPAICPACATDAARIRRDAPIKITEARIMSCTITSDPDAPGHVVSVEPIAPT